MLRGEGRTTQQTHNIQWSWLWLLTQADGETFLITPAHFTSSLCFLRMKECLTEKLRDAKHTNLWFNSSTSKGFHDMCIKLVLHNWNLKWLRPKPDHEALREVISEQSWLFGDDISNKTWYLEFVFYWWECKWYLWGAAGLHTCACLMRHTSLLYFRKAPVYHLWY